MTALSVTVNGAPVQEDVEDRTLLVHFLRDSLQSDSRRCERGDVVRPGWPS